MTKRKARNVYKQILFSYLMSFPSQMLVENREFFTANLDLMPTLRFIPSNFAKIDVRYHMFGLKTIDLWGSRLNKSIIVGPTFSRFDTVHECHRQSDGRMDEHRNGRTELPLLMANKGEYIQRLLQYVTR